MRRLRGGAGGLLLVCWLTACDLEFTDPPRDLPAQLTVSVNVTDEEAEIFRLNARLAPGTDGEGVPRPIRDDTLRVIGTTVAPASIQRNGVRLYSKNAALNTDVELGGLELSAPLVHAGAGGGGPSVPFAMRRRAGPGTLTIQPEETIELLLSDVVPDVGSPTRASWELQIRPAESGSVLFTIRSPTAPPSVIRIPVGLVAEEPGVELAADLQVTERWDWEDGRGDYRIELEAVSRLRWTLRWQDPPEDDDPEPSEADGSGK